MDVCYRFNELQIGYNFPIRGVLVYDDMEMITGKQFNEIGGMYNVNMIYGKGLINAHRKTESQSWAGCVIDDSIVRKINEIDTESIAKFIDPIAIKYMVPYNDPILEQQEEYVLRLTKEALDADHYHNYKRDVIEVFKKDNKGMDGRAEAKLNNTLRFLSIFRKV